MLCLHTFAKQLWYRFVSVSWCSVVMVTVLVFRAVSCCFLFCLWERSCLVVVDHMSVRAFICMLHLFVKHGCVLVLDGCWFSVMLSWLCLRSCALLAVLFMSCCGSYEWCVFSCFAMCFKLPSEFLQLNACAATATWCCIHIAVLGYSSIVRACVSQ